MYIKLLKTKSKLVDGPGKDVITEKDVVSAIVRNVQKDNLMFGTQENSKKLGVISFDGDGQSIKRRITPLPEKTEHQIYLQNKNGIIEIPMSTAQFTTFVLSITDTSEEYQNLVLKIVDALRELKIELK